MVNKKKETYNIKHFSIALPIELYNKLKLVANMNEHNVSSYVRYIIKEKLLEYEDNNALNLK